MPLKEIEQAARAADLLESWDIAITARSSLVRQRTAVDDSEARAAFTRRYRRWRAPVTDVPRARLAAIVRSRY